MSNGNKVDPLTQHLQTYTQEREPDFGSRLLEAMSHLAVEYGREPIELMEQTHRYLQGNTSGKKVLVGDTWMDAEAIPLAQALAGEFMGGGMASRLASPPPPGSLGIFGGAQAARNQRYKPLNDKLTELEEIRDKMHTANSPDELDELQARYNTVKQEAESMPLAQSPEIERQFNKAVELYTQVDPKKASLDQLDNIRKETGWFKPEWYRKSPQMAPGDTKWRFEIDDSKLRFKKATVGNEEAIKAGAYIAKNRLDEGMDAMEYNLGELIEHQELFDSYPELAELKVSIVRPDFMDADGMYSPSKRHLILNSQQHPDEMKETLIHELQHAVQHIEGFSPGGNPDAVADTLFASQYQRSMLDRLIKDYSKLKKNPGVLLDAQKRLIREHTKKELIQMRDDLDIQLSEVNDPYSGYRMLPGEQESRDVAYNFKLVHNRTTRENMTSYDKQMGREFDKKPYSMLIFEVDSNGNTLSIDYRPAKTLSEAEHVGGMKIYIQDK